MLLEWEKASASCLLFNLYIKCPIGDLSDMGIGDRGIPGLTIRRWCCNPCWVGACSTIQFGHSSKLVRSSKDVIKCWFDVYGSGKGVGFPIRSALVPVLRQYALRSALIQPIWTYMSFYKMGKRKQPVHTTREYYSFCSDTYSYYTATDGTKLLGSMATYKRELFGMYSARSSFIQRLIGRCVRDILDCFRTAASRQLLRNWAYHVWHYGCQAKRSSHYEMRQQYDNHWCPTCGIR